MLNEELPDPTWVVVIDVMPTTSEDLSLTDRAVDAFTASFRDFGLPVALTHESRSLKVVTEVSAPNVVEGVTKACKHYSKAVGEIDLPPLDTYTVKILSEKAVEDTLFGPPAALDLVGVAELSEALGVSRQRVSELWKKHSHFPKPIAEIRAGPVWRKNAIDAFVKRWRRKAGRPRTDETPTSAATPVEEVAERTERDIQSDLEAVDRIFSDRLKPH